MAWHALEQWSKAEERESRGSTRRVRRERGGPYRELPHGAVFPLSSVFTSEQGDKEGRGGSDEKLSAG